MYILEPFMPKRVTNMEWAIWYLTHFKQYLKDIEPIKTNVLMDEYIYWNLNRIYTI